MSIITIHPENENQINLLKDLLKELKISFEIEKEEGLTDSQRKKLLEGIAQADLGDFVTENEVKERLDQGFK